MAIVVLRCFALCSLAVLVGAEDSISEMLNSEAVKNKRTDISVSAESGSGPFAAPSQASEDSAKSHSKADKNSDTKGGGLNSLSSLMGGGTADEHSDARAQDAGGLVDDKVSDWNGHKVDLSKSSRQIISGMIEAFMHRADLEPGEKQCLEHSVGTLGADLVDAGRDAVSAIKDMVKGNTSNFGGMLPLVMDAGMKLTSMVSVGTQMARNCVQGDALALLNQTGQNLINMTYISKRLVVSGIDLAQTLADSIVSFEEHHFYKFGKDIGTALRKVVLSNAQTGKKLPEGIPKEYIIEQATEGLSSGFFARGMHLVITDKADSRVHMDINLHKCIAGNDQLFKTVWNGVWTLIAQFAANKEQHGLAPNFTNFLKPSQGQPQWSSELLMAMMEIPSALSNCGLDTEMQTMLGEAIKSLGQLNFKMKMPHEKVKADRATEHVALAVEAWTKFKWKEFGMEVGKLLRELLLLIFPKLYSVDAYGKLQRNFATDYKVSTGGWAASFYIVTGFLLMILMSVVSLKALRTVSRLWQRGGLFVDLETAADQDDDNGAE